MYVYIYIYIYIHIHIIIIIVIIINIRIYVHFSSVGICASREKVNLVGHEMGSQLHPSEVRVVCCASGTK